MELAGATMDDHGVRTSGRRGSWWGVGVMVDCRRAGTRPVGPG